MMWKRNSSCCAGGNVNWTAILESNLSEPSEVKDMHNVAFLMSHAKQVSGAKHIIIITYSKSPHHFPLVAWDNTMRTKYHPTHSRSVLKLGIPENKNMGCLNRGWTAIPTLLQEGKKDLCSLGKMLVSYCDPFGCT